MMRYYSNSIIETSGREHKLPEPHVPYTRGQIFFFIPLPPCLLYHQSALSSVKSCVEFNPLFVNNHSPTSRGCPASQTPTQVAHSTDEQTRAISTFPSSLCVHLNTRYNDIHLTDGRTTQQLTVCAPACDGAEDGRQDDPKNTKKISREKEKKTAAF